MSFQKDFDELLNGILTDYRNQSPAADTTVGSFLFIRAACLASALWGAYRYMEHIRAQIHPDTGDSATLDHFCTVHDILRLTGEADSALLQRLISQLRQPPAGGNRLDFERWAGEVEIDDYLHNPTSGMISFSGLGNTSAAACVDDSTSTKAWDSDSATEDSSISIDLGAGHARNYAKVRLWCNTAGSTASYDVEYSDNGSDWISATTGFVPSVNGWNSKEWNSVGAHRYWRLVLTNVPGAGPDVYEFEWYSGAETVVVATCVPGTGTEAGYIWLYILGNLGTGAPTDSLLEAVNDNVDEQRPVVARDFEVLSPTVTTQAVTLTATGSDANKIQIGSDIEAMLNGLAIGQTLYRSTLIAIAIQNGAVNATVSVPASDVIPADDEVLRAGTVTVS